MLYNNGTKWIIILLLLLLSSSKLFWKIANWQIGRENCLKTMTLIFTRVFSRNWFFVWYNIISDELGILFNLFRKLYFYRNLREKSFLMMVRYSLGYQNIEFGQFVPTAIFIENYESNNLYTCNMLIVSPKMFNFYQTYRYI